MNKLPTLGFLRASLKFWQALARRDDKRHSRDLRKIALRRKQIAERERLNANRPTVMFDSVTVAAIPNNAQAVAGYTSGLYPTFPTLVKSFPHAKRVSIAVSASHDAECLDVEAGDAPPTLAANWVRRQHGRGVKRPVVYCSVSGAQSLLDLLARSGIGRGQVRLWTAHYTLKAHLCDSSCGFGLRSRADATQWTDKSMGRNLDESRVDPGFWV